MSDSILSDAGLQTKCCSKCKRDLPLSAFCKNRTKKDGYNVRCKECIAEYHHKWYQSNREKIAERVRNYQQANKEKIAERERKYWQANKDKITARHRNYKQANKEKIAVRKRNYRIAHKEEGREARAEYKRKWHQANREKVAEYHHKNYLAHPEIAKANNHKRRARKQNASGSHTAQDIRDLLCLQKGKCAGCCASIKKSYHIDHIVPLVRNGSNDKYNLQLLCGPCNQRKHAKDPIEFMQQQGFLL